MASNSLNMGEFKFNKGTFSNSPTFYTPATDRDKAIARLQMMAGDPTVPAECEEQEEARKYLKQVIREDPELRQRLKFWKQYVDAPNGRERIYKEIVLPKSWVSIFAKMRLFLDVATSLGDDNLFSMHFMQ